MTEQTTSTSIEPVIARGRVALKESGGNIRSVAEAMMEPYHPDVARTETVEFPPVPGPLVLDEETKKALKALPRVFAVVQPEERRPLSDEELAKVYEEREVLGKIVDLLVGRQEDIKTLVRHHMDAEAEAKGIAVPRALVDHETGQVIVEATDRDANGHYVLCAPQNPERCPIPGTNFDFSREYRKGAISVETNLLDTMVEAGEITRDVYLAMTREQRVFDPSKAMDKAVHGEPEVRDGILRAIKAMTKVGRPGTSLFVRKRK